MDRQPTCRILAGASFLLILIPLVPSAAVAQSGAGAPAAKPAAKSARPKIAQYAFFTLEAQGVDAKVSSIVSDTILINLAKLPDSTVIGSKEIDAMLGYEQKKQLSGCTDTSCMVAIGGALGVDKIIMGSVGKLGESHVFNVKLLDIRAAKIEQMYQNRIKGASEEAFLDLVPEALAALFPAHAGVWVKANPPLEPPGGKSTGKGARAGVGGVVETKPSLLAEWPGIYPWVVVGAGAAAVVAGGVVHYLAKSDYDAWKSMPETDSANKSKKDAIATKQTAAFVMYGVGGAAAIGGVVWLFLTDGAKTSEAGPAKAGVSFAPLPFPIPGVSMNLCW